MRRAISLLLSLAVLTASAADLQLKLPRAPFVLDQVEMPLLARESQLLFAENELVQKLLPLFREHKNEQVLAAFKERYGDLATQLEAGDPTGEVANKTVDGNLSTATHMPAGAVSAALLYFIGNAYMTAQNSVAAEAAFKAALKPLPDYIRVHESLGILYLLDDRAVNALPHLSRAVQLGLASPNLYGALGWANQKLDNPFGAQSAFQAAMMLEPGNEQWQQGLSVEPRREQAARSRPRIGGSIARRPSLTTRVYGCTARRSPSTPTAGRKGSTASKSLCASATTTSRTCRCALRCISARKRRPRRDAARRGHREGHGLSLRGSEHAVARLRDQWAALQKLLDEYKNVSSLDDAQKSRLLVRRASVSEHNKDTAQERSQLEQALALDPGNAEALLVLGQLHQRDKNYAQAELLLERATAYATVAEAATLTLAQVAIDQHNYDKALKLLRDVHTANPARTDLARNIEALEALVLVQQ